ncbi:MAG: tRNA lysidine(34) synthetase TilS [bacterium]|nr:tRNA lysidine(34) synthetase TilS [bacterium]
MNEFVSAVNRGWRACEQRIAAGQTHLPDMSPPAAQSERTLVAVSGGADSVALLRALMELVSATEHDCRPGSLVVAHLNHGLRGADSDADADWLTETCRALNLPLVLEKQELTSQQTGSSTGLEELSRSARYEFLIRTAHAEDCTRIAVAHTRDDQAETVLHHIIRGTGISGLKGIPRVRLLAENLYLVRPLLDLGREEVVHYLQECGQEFCTDASNTDLRFTRNRIRHELLPYLKTEFNPAVVQALQRLSQQAEEVTEVISADVTQILNRATLDRNRETWRLDCDQLLDTPDYLVKQCFLKIWQEMHWSRKRMGFDHWQRLLELTREGQKIHLPDQIEAERRERLLILRRLPDRTET